MKIIKKGVVPKKDKTFQWTCNGCDSLIESGRNEGRYESDSRDGDAIVAKCPVYQKETWIAETLFK